MVTDRHFQVMLIEDNPGDATLIKEAFTEIAAPVTLHVLGNAILGLSFLAKQGEYSWKPTPELVLLDINLPLLNGLQALAVIKGSPELRDTPVIMLSSSQREEDRQHALSVGAIAYLVKPSAYESYVVLVKDILARLQQARALQERAAMSPHQPKPRS